MEQKQEKEKDGKKMKKKSKEKRNFLERTGKIVKKSKLKKSCGSREIIEYSELSLLKADVFIPFPK